MKIGLLYEPAYWFFLEKLIRNLEGEVHLTGGQSVRLSPDDLDNPNVDVIYVLPCEVLERLKRIEGRHPVINSTRAQEIAISKIETSRLLIDNGLPTPQTIISQNHEPILNALDEFGILLLKSTNLCGGLGHRVLRRHGTKITTFSRGRNYQVSFGARNHIRNETIVLGSALLCPAIHRRCDRTEQSSVAHVRVGKQVVMGTLRVKEYPGAIHRQRRNWCPLHIFGKP